MATKEDYLRKQEVLKLWGQIVDLFLSVHGGTLNNGSTNSPLTIKAGGTTTLHKNYSVITYLDNNSTAKGGQMGFYQDTPELRTWNGSSYSSWYTIYHTGNCNKSDVSWTCNNLTAYGTIQPNSNLTQNIGTTSKSFADVYTAGVISTLNGGLRFGASNTSGSTRFSWYKDGSSYVSSNKLMELDKDSHLFLSNNSDLYLKVIPTSGEAFSFGASSNGGYIWGYTISGPYFRFKDGKIGVRTNNPLCALDVVGDIQATGGMAAEGVVDLSLQTSTSAYLLLRNTGLSLTSNPNGISYNHTIDPNTSGMFPNNNWASAILTIRRHSDNGYTSQLGFSNTEMYFRTSLSGSWYTIYHSGNNGSASDRRLKSNIKPLTLKSAKDIVMGVNPVTFKWNKKAGELRGDLKGEDLGLIAQDVKDLVPSAIGTIFDEYEKLDYTKFIAPLIKVVQEQQREIDELKKQLNNK